MNIQCSATNGTRKNYIQIDTYIERREGLLGQADGPKEVQKWTAGKSPNPMQVLG